MHNPMTRLHMPSSFLAQCKLGRHSPVTGLCMLSLFRARANFACATQLVYFFPQNCAKLREMLTTTDVDDNFLKIRVVSCASDCYLDPS